MPSFDARLRAWVTWLAPFIVVALVLGWETDWGRTLKRVPRVDAPAQPQPVSVALLPEFTLQGAADARRDTVERTLFNPTRRPAPPAPPPAAAAPTMPKGTFALTGTTVVDGKATAFLREVNGGKVRRVQKGETVNGMLVEDVKTDRVRLTLAGDAEEVTMKIATGPRSTIQPAAPAAPGGGAAPGQSMLVPGPGQPVAGAAQPPVVQDVADVLAQRRRAARAAEAAAAQQNQAPPNATPQNVAPPVVQPAQPAQNAPAAAGQRDPGWNAVYQRYMQPRQR
jgi:hypothetical protein